MNRHLVLVGTVICLISGCDSRNEQEKLRGDWRLKEMNGDFDFFEPPAKADGPFMTFDDDKFSCWFKGDDGKESVTGIITCDTTKSPKQITFAYRGRRIVAIYRVSSRILEICVGEKDDIAPTKFAVSGETSRPALLVFERFREP